MPKVFPRAVTVTQWLLSVAVLGWASASFAGDKTNAAAKDGSDGVFGVTRVWKIHLDVSVEEWTAMQPPAGGFGGPGGAPPTPPIPRNPKDKRERERNLFGTEFPWAHGDFSIEGKAYKNVGVRFAGEITYLVSSQGLKRPLTIDFNKFGDQRFEGLTSLQLHAMPMDPAKGREIVACSLFRAAGVPAPRTAFAEVTLTVPGKFDNEYVGLYAVVENIDKQFLEDRFGTDKGCLMKPFQVRSIEYFGDDWERYKGLYRPQSEPTKEEAQRIIAFTKLVHQAGDDAFKKERLIR